MSNLLEQAVNELAEKFIADVLPAITKEFNVAGTKELVFCYSETEAAKKLQVSKSTMERLRKAGAIDFSLSPSGKPVYMAHHLFDYLARNERRNGRQEVTLNDVLGNNVAKFPLKKVG